MNGLKTNILQAQAKKIGSNSFVTGNQPKERFTVLKRNNEQFKINPAPYGYVRYSFIEELTLI